MNLNEAIRARHAVRTYLSKPLPQDVVEALSEKIEECNRRGRLHIQLVLGETRAFQGRLAKYGKFAGVENYLVVAGPKDNTLDERAGYYGEQLVLLAQTLGLNTCWVGLSYSKVPGTYTLAEGEKVACYIALGYGATQGTGHKVKTAEQVSNASEATPEWFRRGVEAALLAPTAINQQKFRFEYTAPADGGLPRVKATRSFSIAGYTQMDLGIAKYHFEVGAGKENFEWAQQGITTEAGRGVLSFLSIWLPSLALAQTVEGTVSDENDAPMPFVNVVQLSQRDSAFVSGTVTREDGTFALENVRDSAIVRISCIGYRTQYVDYTGQPHLAIKLAESSAVLGEVVVRSNLPKTVLRGEGMTTTVAGTILEKTSDINQLLSRLPGVSARDGAIEVFGRGTPVIYINGRKIHDAMELQRLQPTDIKKVEVITNPGARYDAGVKSVIRITTKKPQGEGLSLDSKTTFRLNEDMRLSSYETLRANYRRGGLDINAFLYGAYTHTPDNKQIEQSTYLADTWRQSSRISQEYTAVNPYARLAASYMFNADNSVGASLSYDRYARNEGDGTMQATSYKNGQLVESSAEDYFSPGRSSKYSANAYYVGKAGNLGIDFNTDYYWFGEKNWMDVRETVTDAYDATEASEVNSHRNNRSSLVASKLVLSLPLWKGELSFGGEYSHVNRRMRYTVEPEVTSNENEQVKESMASAFIDYSRAFGPLQVQAGVRYEYNDFDYYDNGDYIAGQSKTYGNWFPSLALSMPVGKTQMQLTYATDIYRPSYSELRSGVQYDNQYTYESGNPFLVPSLTRNLTYAFSWSWLNLNLIYSHISDEVCTMTQIYKDDPMKSLARPENIHSYNSFQAGLTLGPTFGIWHPQLEVMLFKQWLRMDTPVGNRLHNPVGVFQLTNTLDFKWLTASVTMTAQTEGNMGNKHVRQGYFNTDLSLYKSLLKNRLTLTLDVSDLFGTGDQHRVFYSGAQRSTLYNIYSTSTVTLGIRYRLNATNSKYKGTGAGQSQKSRM